MSPETLLRRMMFGAVGLMILGSAAASLYAAYSPREPFLGVPLAAPAPPEPSDVASLVVLASDRYGVPWRASMALAESESGLRVDAVSQDGCCFGVMQLNAKYFFGARAMSVQENVDNGVRYLKAQILWCEALSDTPGLDGGVQYAHFNGDGIVTRDRLTGKMGGCAVDRYRGKKR